MRKRLQRCTKISETGGVGPTTWGPAEREASQLGLLIHRDIWILEHWPCGMTKGGGWRTVPAQYLGLREQPECKASLSMSRAEEGIHTALRSRMAWGTLHSLRRSLYADGSSWLENVRGWGLVWEMLLTQLMLFVDPVLYIPNVHISWGIAFIWVKWFIC